VEVVRRHRWRPAQLAAIAVDRWAWLDVRTEFNRRVSPLADADGEDFLVPLSTAGLGGLGLIARRDQARWYGSGGIEGNTLSLVERALPRGGTFVDCGANIGVFTVAAGQQVGEKGRVVAFEPDPRTRRLLERNVERHGLAGQVEVHAQAVGRANEQRSFIQYANDVVSGFLDAPDVFSPGTVVGRLPVQIVPLDEAIDGPVDLIKVDVEGFEPDVLAGAARMLGSEPRPVLIVELNPAAVRANGRDPSDLLDPFAPDEWAIWLIDETASSSHDRFRLLREEASTVRPHDDPSWYGNLLIVPAERKDEISRVIAELTDTRSPADATIGSAPASIGARHGGAEDA
jgi:FkbM family methyltransferase